MYNVVLVDDHSLLRSALAGVINSYDEFNVLFEADNGIDFIKQVDKNNLPDIVLLDINMPEMDGFETAKWLKQTHPKVKVLALSMSDEENSIIRMLKNGARGYILKNTRSKELLEAFYDMLKKGFYFNEQVSNKIADSLNSVYSQEENQKITLILSNKEIEFLNHICSEKTYKEIAEAMGISPRTVDSHRDILFEKLNVKSRVGLVLYAIKNKIVVI